MMKDSQGLILYIGKAKDLKKRVSSYFASKQHDLKTIILVSQIHTIHTIVTKSETEALILENQLIKQHLPKYNILLKDDKSYPYIALTNEIFPRLIITRKNDDKSLKYFGPYPSIGSTKVLRRMLLDLFPIRDCRQPITLERQQPKCILMDIGKCVGPCVKKETFTEYQAVVKDLTDVLMGRDKDLIKKLQAEMLVCSENLHFEKAAMLRDKIGKIQLLTERQTVDINQKENYHVWGVAENPKRIYVIIQEIVAGKLLHQHGFFYDKQADIPNSDIIEQLAIQFQDKQHSIPNIILCPEDCCEILRTTLKNTPFKGEIITPKRGQKSGILDNAQKNAMLSLSRSFKLDFEKRDDADLLDHVQATLGLDHKPMICVGFDISHLQGKNIVASAVYFSDGKPLKSGYRRFIIRTVAVLSNDPLSIREVVGRRLDLCEREHEPSPDLLVIDGGRAQLNFALSALAQRDLLGRIACVSLAKKQEEIYLPGQKEPLRLANNDPTRLYLQRIRDEAHRFALKFQRSKRKQDLI